MGEPLHQTRAMQRFRRAGPAERERALAAHAAARDGIVTTRQLRSLGFSDGAISHRTRTGQLHRLFHGVYAVGYRAVSERGMWRAAVHACGPVARLGRRSAARAWGLPSPRGPGVEVVVSGGGRTRPGLRVYRAPLRPDDCEEIDGIPVTAVPRTLIDLAAVVEARVLEKAVIEAERRNLLDVPAALALCTRGRRGAGALREIITKELAPLVGTESELEVCFQRLLARHKVPSPLTNVLVDGLRVDCLWPDSRLVVELDGHAFHRTPGDQRRDAARDRRLTLAGYRVLRFTWADVTDDGPAAVATVRAGLEIRAKTAP